MTTGDIGLCRRCFLHVDQRLSPSSSLFQFNLSLEGPVLSASVRVCWWSSAHGVQGALLLRTFPADSRDCADRINELLLRALQVHPRGISQSRTEPFSHATDSHDNLFSPQDAFHETLFKMFQMLLLGENGVCILFVFSELC